MNKIWTGLSVVAAVIAAMVFFYPTPYVYEDGGMTRTNRFTGTVEHASSDGWELAKPTMSPEEADPVTPQVTKAFEAVTVQTQDFDGITFHNPGPWSLTVIEKGEVTFGGDCGDVSDYVTYITPDRSFTPGQDQTLRLPLSDNFKKQLASKCGGKTVKRTLSLILNSGFDDKGTRWDAQAKLVSRKIEGDVTIPAS